MLFQSLTTRKFIRLEYYVVTISRILEHLRFLNDFKGIFFDKNKLLQKELEDLYITNEPGF